jgi:hypothetical protein
MGTDLAVETALIRQAAQVLDDAWLSFSTGGQATMCSPLHDGSLGSSAVAREVAGAASRRVEQAVQAAALLADRTRETANGLRTVAAAFDDVESSAIAPPR